MLHGAKRSVGFASPKLPARAQSLVLEKRYRFRLNGRGAHKAFQLVSEEFLKHYFSHLKWVERQRIRILSIFNGRVLTRPEWSFERKPFSDVFQNAGVWRKTQGSNELPVCPLRKCQPINNAMHCVQVDCSTGSFGDEPIREF